MKKMDLLMKIGNEARKMLGITENLIGICSERSWAYGDKFKKKKK